MTVRTVSHPARLIPRELLVPKGTPEGDPAQRVAWARAGDDLVEIVQVERDGADVAYRRGLGNGVQVKSADELAEDYERADGAPV